MRMGWLCVEIESHRPLHSGDVASLAIRLIDETNHIWKVRNVIQNLLTTRIGSDLCHSVSLSRLFVLLRVRVNRWASRDQWWLTVCQSVSLPGYYVWLSIRFHGLCLSPSMARFLWHWRTQSAELHMCPSGSHASTQQFSHCEDKMHSSSSAGRLAIQVEEVPREPMPDSIETAVKGDELSPFFRRLGVGSCQSCSFGRHRGVVWEHGKWWTMHRSDQQFYSMTVWYTAFEGRKQCQFRWISLIASSALSNVDRDTERNANKAISWTRIHSISCTPPIITRCAGQRFLFLVHYRIRTYHSIYFQQSRIDPPKSGLSESIVLLPSAELWTDGLADSVNFSESWMIGDSNGFSPSYITDFSIAYQWTIVLIDASSFYSSDSINLSNDILFAVPWPHRQNSWSLGNARTLSFRFRGNM
jgi:hypothetical protein